MTISTSIEGRVGTITLNRPEARNALTAAMLAEFEQAVVDFDHDDAIGAIILTGADPAFCAGLDLKDLTNTYNGIGVGAERPKVARRGLSVERSTPMLGAINGPAVTGGLELALGCDFLIGSHRATFADTHARVGILPGGGMTIRLPELIGINRARQLSFTGAFIDAGTACEWGLLNEVVPHGALLSRAMELATQIAETNPSTLAALGSLYAELAGRTDDEAYREEGRASRTWMSEKFDARVFDRQRQDLIERGSKQQR